MSTTDLTRFLAHHPSLQFSREMQAVCAPLFRLGICYFSHVRTYPDNTLIANASHPDFFRYYFEHQLYNSGLHTDVTGHFQRYVYWDELSRSETLESVHQSTSAFGLHHFFTIVVQGMKSHDYYHFAAPERDAAMETFYSTHLELLEKFVAWYNRAFLLNDKLYRASKWQLPFLGKAGAPCRLHAGDPRLSAGTIDEYLASVQYGMAGKDRMPALSRRELQCALYMLEGKTSAEIATLLNLSPRTVEVYFERLKARFGSKNKIQLARHLVEYGIPDIQGLLTSTKHSL